MSEANGTNAAGQMNDPYQRGEPFSLRTHEVSPYRDISRAGRFVTMSGDYPVPFGDIAQATHPTTETLGA